MDLHLNKSLRKIAIPLLKKLNPGKVYIKHHYTNSRFALDAFIHKGYWYHGKNREKETMSFFKAILKPGATVFEVGGHIGYITNYFSQLVTDKGKVYVFEPGYNNLPYLKENIDSLNNVILTEKAVSDSNGMAKFYIENISGQNNSLLSDYGNRVKKNAFVEKDEAVVEVETITLDSFCQEKKLIPDFIKIDIEGAELMALKGASDLLAHHHPMMMIEITKNNEAIFDLLKNQNYVLVSEDRLVIDSNNQDHYGNTFCFHTTKHKNIIDNL